MMTELKRVLTTISILTLILAGRPSDAQKSKAPAASSTTAPTAAEHFYCLVGRIELESRHWHC
jgi:hypothetical protein